MAEFERECCGVWIEAPRFVGPITEMMRDGKAVELVCLPEERLGHG